MLKLFFPSATEYVPPSIQGYNARPFNTGKPLDHSAISDTANFTYVNDRRLLDKVSLPSHQSLSQLMALLTLSNHQKP